MTAKHLVFSGALLAFAASCAPSSSPAPAPAAAPQPPRGDGIHVKGHWVAEVINPDGSIARTDEFDNALVVSGTTLLARLLSPPQGNVPIVTGGWLLSTISVIPAAACGLNAQGGVDLATPAQPFCAIGTIQRITDSDTGAVQLAITADLAAATEAATSDVVAAWMVLCAGQAGAPPSCQFSPFEQFSSADRAIPREAGQALRLRVTYTFN